MKVIIKYNAWEDTDEGNLNEGMKVHVYNPPLFIALQGISVDQLINTVVTVVYISVNELIQVSNVSYHHSVYCYCVGWWYTIT